MWTLFTSASARTVSGSRQGAFGPAAVRHRRQERRVGLDQQLVERDHGRGLPQLRRVLERERRRRRTARTRPPTHSRAIAASPEKQWKTVRSGAPSSRSTRRTSACASRSWIISALPARLASAMCRRKCLLLRGRLGAVPVVVQPGLADRHAPAGRRPARSSSAYPVVVEAADLVGVHGHRGVRRPGVPPPRPRTSARTPACRRP